ncbi:MAG: hypothetical protein DMG49_16340 [Acidobacteria bacterium]|nr:MAG: hypothetical protein DMG49_16340 [Acidobacteriota bacterium]
MVRSVAIGRWHINDELRHQQRAGVPESAWSEGGKLGGVDGRGSSSADAPMALDLDAEVRSQAKDWRNMVWRRSPQLLSPRQKTAHPRWAPFAFTQGKQSEQCRALQR